jgi:hypothetical protein
MSIAISLNLNFSGVVLPVVEGEDGLSRVPFKTLVEALGVDWKRQYRRTQTLYFQRRLGICVGHVSHAGQQREVVLIRLDRVCAWLNSLNPESIRAAGNAASADFLEQKHEEWDNLLHAYEIRQGRLFSGSVKKALAIARIDQMRDARLKALALSELGVNLTELPAAPTTGDLFRQQEAAS